METLISGFIPDKGKIYGWALSLALITIIYNVLEGAASIFLGLEDDTIALFGFGLDSFVEVISGIGIFHMVTRLRKYGQGNPDRFEQRALRITGTAFFVLAAGLIVAAGINLQHSHTPETTLWGIIIASVSIITMWMLIHHKLKVGKLLNSDAIVADAHCTRACLYLSVILLVSSIGYELTGIGGIDSLGAVGIALLSFKEGKESFEKARGKSCKCNGSCSP